MNGNSTDGLKFPVPHVPPFFNYNSMGRLGRNKEEKQRAKQEREHQYRLNSEAKAKKKERDRVHRERKKEQARLACHEDPLAQLADVATQREYLDEENDVIIEVVPGVSRAVKDLNTVCIKVFISYKIPVLN